MVSCSSAGDCGGGSPYTASAFLKNTGSPEESRYPYTHTNGQCATACANWQSSAYTISEFYYIARTVNDLKQALVSYGPISTAYYVYGDFYNYQSGVYEYVSGSYMGGHAVLLVGYDDAQQAFICKNSWGGN